MLEKNGGGWERMDKGHFLLNVEVNERNRRKVLEGETLGPRERLGASAEEFVCEVGGSVGGRDRRRGGGIYMWERCPVASVM